MNGKLPTVDAGRGETADDSIEFIADANPQPMDTVEAEARRDTSLSGRARDALQLAIRLGELAPGDKLNEVEWASRLGVSRAPVREAFRALEQGGLVELHRNRGVYVRVVSEQEANELYALRAVLESHACRLLAEQIDANKAAALRGMLDEMSAASADGHHRRYAQLNRAFHDLIVVSAGNRKLYGIYGQMIDELLLSPHESPERDPAQAIGESLAEHRALVTALASRDGESAAQIMQTHIIAGPRRALDGLLKTRSSTPPETSA